jgi:NDP-sugar pyrophosphorylase family protein
MMLVTLSRSIYFLIFPEMKNLFFAGIFVFSLSACNNRNPNHESSGIPTENGSEINDKTIRDNKTYQEHDQKPENQGTGN